MELIAIALQMIGTTMVTLFSFFGLQIRDDPDAYMAGTQKISLSPRWLYTAKFGLVLLLIGLTLSLWTELSDTPL